MNNTSIKLVGMDVLLARLKALPKKVANKGARRAVQAGSKPILDSEKADVPTDTGLLKKSLGRKVGQKAGNAFAVVGPRKGFAEATKTGRIRFRSRKKGAPKPKGAKEPTRYAHLAEKHKSFVIAAYEKNREASVAIVAKELGDFIETEAPHG